MNCEICGKKSGKKNVCRPCIDEHRYELCKGCKKWYPHYFIDELLVICGFCSGKCPPT